MLLKLQQLCLFIMFMLSFTSVELGLRLRSSRTRQDSIYNSLVMRRLSTQICWHRLDFGVHF